MVEIPPTANTPTAIEATTSSVRAQLAHKSAMTFRQLGRKKRKFIGAPPAPD